MKSIRILGRMLAFIFCMALFMSSPGMTAYAGELPSVPEEAMKPGEMFFAAADTAEPAVSDEPWSLLQQEILAAPDGEETSITVSENIRRPIEGTALIVPEGKIITLYMKGVALLGDASDSEPRAHGGLIENYGTLTIIGGYLTAGRTTGSGGGIYVGEGAVLNLDATVISNNSAEAYGGGLFICGGTVNMTNTAVIEGSRSTLEGEAVYMEKGTERGAVLTMNQNSVIVGNHQQGSERRSGVYVGSGCKVTNEDAFIAGNYRPGIYLASGSGSENAAELKLIGKAVAGSDAVMLDNEGDNIPYIDLTEWQPKTDKIYVALKNALPPGEGILVARGTREKIKISDFENEGGYHFAFNDEEDAIMMYNSMLVTYAPGDENADGSMDPDLAYGSFILPDCAFTVSGYRGFKEWSVVIGEGEAQAKKPGDEIFVTADTTVTAVWDTRWNLLQQEILAAPDGVETTITIWRTVYRTSDEAPLIVPKGKIITLNMRRDNLYGDTGYPARLRDNGSVIENYGTLTIIQGNIGLGKTAGAGGGIYVGEGGVLNLDETVIQTCEAGTYGGGIFIHGGTVNMTNESRVATCFTKGDGAAIYMERGEEKGAELTMSGKSLISGMYSTVPGSSIIYVGSGCSMTIDGCHLNGNHPNGIYLASGEGSEPPAELKLTGEADISDTPVMLDNGGGNIPHIDMTRWHPNHGLASIKLKNDLPLGEKILAARGVNKQIKNVNFENDKGYQFLFEEDAIYLRHSAKITFIAGSEDAGGTMEPGGAYGAYTLPDCEFTAPEHMVFKEWIVKIGDGEEQLKKPGDEILVMEDATATAVWEDITIPTFRTHALVLSGKIGVCFFMELPEIEGVDYGQSYMEFTVMGKKERMDFDPDRMNESRTFYRFECYVSSIMMAEEVTATFHYGENETVGDTYSVMQYIRNFQKSDPVYDGVNKLIWDLADFGHYIQPFLAEIRGWTIDEAYAEMTEYFSYMYSSYDERLVREGVADYAVRRDADTAEIAKTSFSLALDSDTSIKLYLTPKSGYKGEVTATVDGSAATLKRLGDGRYCVVIPNIAAHKLGDMHTVRVSAGGEFTIEISALSYVQSVLNSSKYSEDQTAVDAMISLYRYYDSAREVVSG